MLWQLLAPLDKERRRKHFWCQEVSGSKGSLCLFCLGVMLPDAYGPAQAGAAALVFLIDGM